MVESLEKIGINNAETSISNVSSNVLSQVPNSSGISSDTTNQSNLWTNSGETIKSGYWVDSTSAGQSNGFWVDNTSPAVKSDFSTYTSQEVKIEATEQYVGNVVKSTRIRDRRTTLNIQPIEANTDNPSINSIVETILGSKVRQIQEGNLVLNGFLYNTLASSFGLIFPYTPRISVRGGAEYDSITILNSNFAYNYYKNTKPTTYDIQQAKFSTATPELALHMLAAIWFLESLSKCEFGEKTTTIDGGISGLPPPVLYLNSYNDLIDNVPVVITSFNWDYPADVDYVNIVINLSGDEGLTLNNIKLTDYTNDKAIAERIAQVNTTNQIGELSIWLPMVLTLSVSLATQPNPLKVKKLFNLDYYKMGIINLAGMKNGKLYSKIVSNNASETNSSKKEDTSISNQYTFNNSGWTW